MPVPVVKIGYIKTDGTWNDFINNNANVNVNSEYGRMPVKQQQQLDYYHNSSVEASESTFDAFDDKELKLLKRMAKY